MKLVKSQKIQSWQSLFLSRIDLLPDDLNKINILRSRVCELEKQNKVLKNKLSGQESKVVKDETVKTISHKDFYKSQRWLKLRFHILNKHKRKCVTCGSLSNLQVDHILPRSIYPEKAFDENNLQVLCKECNFGKSNSVY